MKKYILPVIVAFLVLLTVSGLSGQVWEVPADQKGIKNPSPFNNENVKAGKELYMLHCKSCHGDPGKNNVIALVPPPPDPASAQMQVNSDADVFYKVSTGRVAMPSFKNTLTDDQRWKIVNFIKSFDPANAGKLVKEEPVPARIQASADEMKSVIAVSAQAQNKSGQWGPLPNAEVSVNAKRTFGSIAIGTAKTNQQGYAEFLFPKSFRGDPTGLVDLEISLGEEFSCNPIQMKQVKIASPTEPENIFRHKVLWSTNPRTQAWVILSYLGVVGGVWLTIFYIIFLIVRIYKAGKD
jgi:mono/diheme cytochrome c family protein